MKSLLDKASEMAGREVSVVPVKGNHGGAFMVEWFDFNGPPPTGATETEALEKFIAHLENSNDRTNTGEQDPAEEAGSPESA